MFNDQNNEEKKLDWMYKGPSSGVNREEYLLGRTVDKTLEQLDEDEKSKPQSILPPPKSRVEHECIPPSIRDFNKIVQSEQVDLSAKLQEDPLVAIKKREEESRREFLQNPVQLKKLQKALKAQQAKKNKRKKSKKHGSDSDLDTKLISVLLGKKKKSSKEERNLDTILIHKYEEFKDKLTEQDIRDVLEGKMTDSNSSQSEEEEVTTKKKNLKKKKKKKRSSSSSDESDDGQLKAKLKGNKRQSEKRYDKRDDEGNREKYTSRNTRENGGYVKRDDEGKREKYTSRNTREDGDRQKRDYEMREHKARKMYAENRRQRDEAKGTYGSLSKTPPRHSSTTESEKRKYDYSDDSEDDKRKKIQNYGLVTSDGVKIPLKRRSSGGMEEKPKLASAKMEPPKAVHNAKRLTKEEKNKLLQEMMQNASWRDKERERNVQRYRKEEDKEKKEQNFDPEFVHRQLAKTTDTSSVESRIKSKLNNIQRSNRDMDKNFSRR